MRYNLDKRHFVVEYFGVPLAKMFAVYDDDVDAFVAYCEYEDEAADLAAKLNYLNKLGVSDDHIRRSQETSVR